MQEKKAAQERDYDDEYDAEGQTSTQHSSTSSWFQPIMHYIALIAVVVVIIAGIGYWTTREKIIQSDNQDFHLTKPRGWKVDNKLNDEADIQIANEKKEGYFIVLSELKTDFEVTVDYKRHSQITRDLMKEELTNYQEVSDPMTVRINGMKGVQYEITASVDEVRIKILHTTLDGDRYFHQLIGGSLYSKYDLNKLTFDKILNSFHEF
jgi:hypothetical protein